MFSKVSVLVPTRQRVVRLQTLLDSYEDTREEDNSEIVFRVDEDDVETIGFLSRRGDCRFVVGPRMQGYDSMPLFFNELCSLAKGDVVMCGNDDMVFKTVDWASSILIAANHFPDGLFDIGVDTHNATHFPFSCVSKKAAERMGFLWDPRIFWGDIFLRDVMAHFGRLVTVPSVQIEHDWAGFAPDMVFIEADKDIVRRIPAYWTEVHAPAVAGAVESLKGLLS